MSPKLASLVKSMLDWNPDKRPSAKQILETGLFDHYSWKDMRLGIIRGEKQEKLYLNNMLES